MRIKECQSTECTKSAEDCELGAFEVGEGLASLKIGSGRISLSVNTDRNIKQEGQSLVERVDVTRL